MFNEQNASLILNQLATAVLQLDTELCIREGNTAAENLLATSIAKLRGQPLARLFPQAEPFLQAARAALESLRSFTERDLLLTRPGQDPLRVDCTLSPCVNTRGVPQALVLELVGTERQHRIQAEEAKLLQNQISTALMRGLAHEVKNPLGGIRGAAQLLERELDVPGLREFTQIIIDEADRLRKLVDRMLGPRGQLVSSQFNIHEVLEHVRQVVAMECPANVEMLRDYDPSLPEVRADRDQLVQVFLNLVRNAVQALAPAGGRLTVRTRAQRKFTIGAVQHRLVLCIEIIDDGPGVPPDLAESIFFPMVSGRAEGSGLGLPIAQSLINRHGGLIDFVSAPGHTVFTVWLPTRNPA